MTLGVRRSNAFALLVSAVALPTAGCREAEQLRLLNQARARYYDLHKQGVSAFSCDVQPQWDQFLDQVRSRPREESPWDAYLKQAHLHFQQPVSGHGDVTWIEPATPPPGKEQVAATMQKAFHDMVAGFLQAITPNLAGTLLPSLPIHPMEPIADGYRLQEDDAQGRHSVVMLDKNFTVKHISMHSTAMHVEADMTYSSSPRGLLLVRMDTHSQDPPTAAALHSVIDTSYAEVSGVLLPTTFTLTTSKGVRIPMDLTHCQVTH